MPDSNSPTPFFIHTCLERTAKLSICEATVSPVLHLRVIHEGKEKLWSPGRSATRLLLKLLGPKPTLESFAGKDLEVTLRRSPFRMEIKDVTPKG